MDETLSDETASIHDLDLCSKGDSLCSCEVNSQEFSQDDSSLYTLEEINALLDDTFGKQVNVKKENVRGFELADQFHASCGVSFCNAASICFSPFPLKLAYGSFKSRFS